MQQHERIRTRGYKISMAGKTIKTERAHFRESAYAGDSMSMSSNCRSWKQLLLVEGISPGSHLPGSPRLDLIAKAFFITCDALRLISSLVEQCTSTQRT
jgi:hypothetical protein